MNNYTDITVLLDRSGSMSSLKKAMIDGFDAFLEPQRATPTTRVTLVQFDSDLGRMDLRGIYTATPVTAVPKLELDPRGGTPLLDALCATIDATGVRLAKLKPEDRPAGVIFVVITDGEENESKLSTKADVKKRIEHQTAIYKWEFVFLGANQDAISEGHAYGIAMGQSMTFASNYGAALNMMRKTGQKVAGSTYYTATTGQSASGTASSVCYSNVDRVEAAEGDEELKKKAQQTP